MDQGLFYIFYPDGDGKPIWKCQLIKQIPFAIATEQGFETVRKYMLNLMKYASDGGLRQLKDDSSKALKQGLTLLRVIRKNGACNLRKLRILFGIRVQI